MGSLLRRIFRKSTLQINSAHHQSVSELATMLRATIRTKRMIVKAIELQPEKVKGLPFLLGYSFILGGFMKGPIEHLKNFKAFVKACR